MGGSFVGHRAHHSRGAREGNFRGGVGEAPRGLDAAALRGFFRCAMTDDHLSALLALCEAGKKDKEGWFHLPEGRRYDVDILDTWNMTVERLPQRVENAVRVPLPARPFMAVRVVVAER